MIRHIWWLICFVSRSHIVLQRLSENGAESVNVVFPSYSLAVLLGVVYIYPILESPGRPQQFAVNLRRPSSLPWMEIRRKQRSPWAIFLVLTEKCRWDEKESRNQKYLLVWPQVCCIVFFSASWNRVRNVFLMKATRQEQQCGVQRTKIWNQQRWG